VQRRTPAPGKLTGVSGTPGARVTIDEPTFELGPGRMADTERRRKSSGGRYHRVGSGESAGARAENRRTEILLRPN
jgi:hypothetical protein